jgi:hypothetical protein
MKLVEVSLPITLGPDSIYIPRCSFCGLPAVVRIMPPEDEDNFAQPYCREHLNTLRRQIEECLDELAQSPSVGAEAQAEARIADGPENN